MFTAVVYWMLIGSFNVQDSLFNNFLHFSFHEYYRHEINRQMRHVLVAALKVKIQVQQFCSACDIDSEL